MTDENKQQAVREPELFRFFEMTPDLVCIASREGYFKHVNQAVIDKLGYSREELLSRPVSSFVHPDDQPMTKRRREKLLKGHALVNFENRYISADGSIIWLHWTSIYIPDEEVVFALAKDITARKEAENEIQEKYNQFKNLASHFKTSLEADKKNLAAELHEQLAQLAWVIKTDLNWIQEHVPPSDDQLKARARRATETTEMLINSIRKMSYSIGPGMIDDLGLSETIAWLCEDFQVANGIVCHCAGAEEVEECPREMALDIFRICQDALNEIGRKNTSNRVQIRIEKLETDIRLYIISDGDTFENENTPSLKSIRERVASVSGSLKFEKVQPGSRLTILLPCPTVSS